MKKLLIAFLMFIFAIGFSSCSKDETTDPPDGSTTAVNYYPGNLGSTFNYKTDTLNTVSGSSATIGNRLSSFDRNETINGLQYIIQKNESTIGGLPYETEVGFRRSNTDISFAIDTSGLNSLIDSVTSALGIQLEVTIDSEIVLFKYPFASGTTWDAFNLTVGAIGLTVPIVEVVARYEGKENLTTVPGMATAEAEKIKYTATIKLPTSLSDIFNPPTEVFEAYGWFVKDVGLAKVEGASIILDAISIGEIDLENTRLARETLIEYSLK